jgi:hypothetical protein
VDEPDDKYAALGARTACRSDCREHPNPSPSSSAGRVKEVLLRRLRAQKILGDQCVAATTLRLNGTAALSRCAIEIHSDPAVRKCLRCFRQNFLVKVAAGNMGQDKLFDAARRRQLRGFGRGEMSIVARHGCVTFKKRDLDNQHVRVTNLFGQSFGGFGIALSGLSQSL